MIDVELIVWKPLIINGRLKKVKCKVKYFINEGIAKEFVDKAESMKGHYIDRDTFKKQVLESILTDMLKVDCEDTTLVKKLLIETNMKLWYIQIYLECVI